MNIRHITCSKGISSAVSYAFCPLISARFESHIGNTINDDDDNTTSSNQIVTHTVFMMTRNAINDDDDRKTSLNQINAHTVLYDDFPSNVFLTHML